MNVHQAMVDATKIVLIHLVHISVAVIWDTPNTAIPVEVNFKYVYPLAVHISHIFLLRHRI